MKQYDTVSIHLSAAILTSVPQAQLLAIDGDALQGDRKVFRLGYPEHSEETAKRVIEAFHEKQLSINLFQYNKQLNTLRDRLKGQETARW